MSFLVAGVLLATSCGDDGNQETSAPATSGECDAIELVAFADEADHDADEADHDDAGDDLHDVDLAYRIDRSEFEFGCDLPAIPAGVPVGLQFVSTGAVEHEAVIGDIAAQDNAEQMMQDLNPDEEMTHSHDTPSITVAPGDVGQLIVLFDEPHELTIGCHIAGHWEAGMHRDFQVVKA